METLKIYFPVKPINHNNIQKFGVENTIPRMIAKYNEIGLKGHNGWDFPTYHGQPVYAAHDGIIVYAGNDGNNGILVVIKTLKAFKYKNGQAFYKTLYGHLIDNIPVKVKDIVKVGDIIGYADNTGWSEGNHLHFGLKPIEGNEEDWVWYNLEPNNGYYGAIDPAPYFNGLYAADYKVIPVVIDIAKQGVELATKVEKEQSIQILEVIKNFLKNFFSKL